jgi:hypothetical protein
MCTLGRVQEALRVLEESLPLLEGAWTNRGANHMKEKVHGS